MATEISAPKITSVNVNPGYVRAKLDDGTATLLYATYRERPCGCALTGDGSLQHPLAVAPCEQHGDDAPMAGDVMDAIAWCVAQRRGDEGLYKAIRAWMGEREGELWETRIGTVIDLIDDKYTGETEQD